MNMIDQQPKEIMKKNSRVSSKCPQRKALSSNVRDARTSLKGSEAKVEFNAKKEGLATEYSSNVSTGSFAVPCESYYGPVYQQDIFTYSSFLPDYEKLQLSQLNGLHSQMYSMNSSYTWPVENQYQYLPFWMFYQGYPYELQFQEFQYFVVIDFEATCDKEKNPYPQEIIEFPSVLVNSMTGQIEASFQTYVRPAYHQHLSDFCKELTGIQQIQVDRGVPLSEALLMHDKWLEEKGIKHTKFAVVTWSNWDCRVMLESECRFKKIRKPPYFNKWINLKVPFHEVFTGVRCNLKEAVQKAGLAWEGRAHCGLDDARNTARLLSYLMQLGFRFSITNSMMCHSADQSVSLQPSPDSSLSASYYPHQLKQSSASLTKSLPAQLDSGKERQQRSVSAGIKIAKARSGTKAESSSVLATGLPPGMAYVFTPSGLLLETTKSINPS